MSSIGKPWQLVDFLNEEDSCLEFSARTQDGKVAQAVSVMLREDGRTRDQIAEDITSLAGEKISRAMLDAYSSKARREHPIPTHRLIALTVLTGRWDVLDALLAPYDIRLATKADVELLMLGSAVKTRKSIDGFIQRALERE